MIHLKPRAAQSSEMGGAKQRGCREDGERERVHSNSEKEKRLKGREANLREKQMQS